VTVAGSSPLRALGALAALALVALAAVEATAAPQTTRRYAARAGTEVSSNWAGYTLISPDATTPIEFTSVTGTWKQPPARCAGAESSASAIWVGLGGYDLDSQALEQIGTDSDCSSAGAATYYAWYEIVPAPPVNLKIKIGPGDVITTSVNAKGNVITLQLINRTRNVRFTKTVVVDNPDLTSAEWITEAPSECSQYNCRPVALADFGSVAISRIAAIGDGHPGTLTDPAWQLVPIQLVPRARGGFFPGRDRGVSQFGSTAGTTAPHSLSADGRGFSLGWRAHAAAGA
jgi:hypothetical protein